MNFTFIKKVTSRNVAIVVLIILILINIIRSIGMAITKLHMIGGPTVSKLNFLIFICLLLIVRFKKREVTSIARFFITILLIISSISATLIDPIPREFIIESPKGKNALILEEGTVSVAFFKRKYLIFKEPLEDYYIWSAEHVYKPISNKVYDINWVSEDELIFQLKNTEYSRVDFFVGESIYSSNEGYKEFSGKIHPDFKKYIEYNNNLEVYKVKVRLD